MGFFFKMRQTKKKRNIFRLLVCDAHNSNATPKKAKNDKSFVSVQQNEIKNIINRHTQECHIQRCNGTK